MRSVVRNTSAVIVGFIAASMVMVVVESVNGRLLFPELAKAAEGVQDRETVRTLLAQAPVGALLVVVAGWALGGLVGGWVSAKLSKAKIRPTYVLGTLLTLAGVANNLMLPPPIWFWFVSLSVLMPAVLIGSRLVSPSTRIQS